MMQIPGKTGRRFATPMAACRVGVQKQGYCHKWLRFHKMQAAPLPRSGLKRIAATANRFDAGGNEEFACLWGEAGDQRHVLPAKGYRVVPWRMSSMLRLSGRWPGLRISKRSANTLMRMGALVKWSRHTRALAWQRGGLAPFCP